MKNLEIKIDPKFESVFENYPKQVRKQMNELRKLIEEVAEEIEVVSTLEETLKWGEPSFLTKNGSTIRIDWKEKMPDQYAIYFKCTSKLVPSFKQVYPNKFKYETNRAIVFNLEDKIPKKELKKCIAAGLTYHKVKHLPELGL